MRDEKQEQQMLWNAALKEIGNTLKREWQPERDAPDHLQELIAKLEAALPKDHQ